jgi:hypothetical protein
LGLRIFQENICIYVTFSLIYHILNPYNPTKIHKQKFIGIKPNLKDKRLVHIFQFQNSNIYIWRIYVIFFYVDVLLFKLGILIQWQILA